MQIVTINIPDMYVDAIGILTGRGSYPSRSEAIRSALRVFLKQELEMCNRLMNTANESQVEESLVPKVAPASRKIDMRSIRAGWNK